MMEIISYLLCIFFCIHYLFFSLSMINAIFTIMFLFAFVVVCADILLWNVVELFILPRAFHVLPLRYLLIMVFNHRDTVQYISFKMSKKT